MIAEPAGGSRGLRAPSVLPLSVRVLLVRRNDGRFFAEAYLAALEIETELAGAEAAGAAFDTLYLVAARRPRSRRRPRASD